MTATQMLEHGLSMLNLQTSPQAVENLMRFCEMLLQKNKVMNLTGASDAQEVVSRHLLDCAAAYAACDFAGATVVDIGTGAGFPGMPLALLYPQAQFTLVDSLQKRIGFLSECIAALDLTNVTAIHARAEELPQRACFDVAVSRAVADLRVLSELCLPQVKVGGRFAAMKSVSTDAEIEASLPAFETLGGVLEAVHNYQIPGTEIPQRLVIIRKERETPGKYPRRFARITKQPL